MKPIHLFAPEDCVHSELDHKEQNTNNNGWPGWHGLKRDSEEGMPVRLSPYSAQLCPFTAKREISLWS